MTPSKPWQSYRQVATITASPGQLILMLYDGALRFMQQALLGFAHDDPLEFNLTINNNILRAQAIIHELDYSLDMKAGGDLSQTLRRLYHYFDNRLQESNVYKKPEGLNETIKRLLVIRDAWAEMLTKQSDPSADLNPDAVFKLESLG